MVEIYRNHKNVGSADRSVALGPGARPLALQMGVDDCVLLSAQELEDAIVMLWRRGILTDYTMKVAHKKLVPKIFDALKEWGVTRRISGDDPAVYWYPEDDPVHPHSNRPPTSNFKPRRVV